MSRPLIICDCDEVLLHFAVPFRGYLAAEHDLDLRFDSFSLAGSIKRRSGGDGIAQTDVEPLLDGFFDTHLETQYPAAGAVEALSSLAAAADIVILTNVKDMIRTRRGAELARHGMPYEVICNRGPKGPPVAALVAERRPSAVLFIDDLPPHHSSVARHAPEVHRLHMIADPELRGLIPAAPDAHARIDDWPTAHPYIRQVLGIA
jgi:hypothetical protein